MSTRDEDLLAEVALGILPVDRHEEAERLRELQETASLIGALAPEPGPLDAALRHGLARNRERRCNAKLTRMKRSSAALSSKSRQTWIRLIVTAWLLCACAPAATRKG